MQPRKSGFRPLVGCLVLLMCLGCDVVEIESPKGNAALLSFNGRIDLDADTYLTYKVTGDLLINTTSAFETLVSCAVGPFIDSIPKEPKYVEVQLETEGQDHDSVRTEIMHHFSGDSLPLVEMFIEEREYERITQVRVRSYRSASVWVWRNESHNDQTLQTREGEYTVFFTQISKSEPRNESCHEQGSS